MKVTSALLFALQFEERNSTKPDCGPNAREIVKTGSVGSSIIFEGSVDEVVARLADEGTDLPTFIATLMEQAAKIAAAQTREHIATQILAATLLASALSGFGDESDSICGFPKF